MIPKIGHRPHVFGSGSATAADPLGTGALPVSSQFAELLYLPVAVPALMHRIPLLARIGINDDGFGGDLRQLADQAIDQLGSRAIDPDPDDLRLLFKQFCAAPKCFSVRNVVSVAAGETEVYGQIGMRT